MKVFILMTTNYINLFGRLKRSLLTKWGQVYMCLHVFKTLMLYCQELVGLLIGKLGRNIKQLKEESGAEITIYETEDDLEKQVLQIKGVYVFLSPYFKCSLFILNTLSTNAV